MSTQNKTPDDEAYDNLIQELGLDIDLDEPIGDAAATGESDEMDLSEDELFRIEDREVGRQPAVEPEFEDTGVELSAELVAELRSVIMGSSADAPVQPEATEAKADVFAVDGVAAPLATEPPPLAEDAFTYDAPDEADGLVGEADEEAESWLDESTTVEDNESAFDDLIAQLTSGDDADLPSDEQAPSDDSLLEGASEFLHPTAQAAEEAEKFEPPEWGNEDDATDDPFAMDDPFGAAEPNEVEPIGEVESDIDYDDDEPSSEDEGGEEGFDLGFDAGVILREVLEERRAAEEEPKFDMSELIEDADEGQDDEVEDEIETASLTSDANGSLADVLGRALEDALASADDAPQEAHDYTEPDHQFEDDQPPSSPFSDAALEDDFSVLDAIEERPLSDFDDLAVEPAKPSVEAEPPPMPPAEADEDVVYSFSMAGDDAGDRLVPRISLHAFCQTAPVTQLMMAVQNDRRMANVSMEVHQGGSAAAFDYYADRSTPHLLIVETTGSPARILAELDQLAERCDENVKVIVVGAANDIRLYRELMHRGVSEYIVPPMETVQLIRSVANLFVDPEQPFMGKSIAVTGVKGGVGASTIAHNLAWVMSHRMESNTTLVDLDLNFGTTGLDFNEESQQTIADAILSPDRFDEAVLERLLTRATDNLSLFTAPATLDRTYDLDVETLDHVMGLVRQSVPFVVMDLPHIWADWFKSAVVGADEIVVVAQPELASLRNGKNLIDFLKAARPNDAPPRLVINNVGVPRRPEIPVKDFAAALDVEPDLVLPFDPQLFGTAANNGQMINEVSPESKCAQGMDYLAALLTGREPPRERQASILNKFFKR